MYMLHESCFSYLRGRLRGGGEFQSPSCSLPLSISFLSFPSLVWNPTYLYERVLTLLESQGRIHFQNSCKPKRRFTCRIYQTKILLCAAKIYTKLIDQELFLYLSYPRYHFNFWKYRHYTIFPDLVERNPHRLRSPCCHGLAPVSS